MELSELLDQMESLVANANRVPATTRALVKTDELLELIQQLRMNLPQTVRDSEEIVRQREEIINQASREANRIRAQAEKDRQGRVDQSDVLREAREKAEETLEETKRRSHIMTDKATAEAKILVQDTNEYIKNTLYNLEEQISGLLSTVRRGIEMLDKKPKSGRR